MAKRASHPMNRNLRSWHHTLKVSPNIISILPWLATAANLFYCFPRKVVRLCSVQVRFQHGHETSQRSSRHLPPENLHYHTRTNLTLRIRVEDLSLKTKFKDQTLRLELKSRLVFFEAWYTPTSHCRLHVSSCFVSLTSTSSLPDSTGGLERFALRPHRLSSHGGGERLYNELGRG